MMTSNGIPDNLQEILFVTTTPSYFLKKAALYLRTEDGMKIVESLTLLLCKVFNELSNQEIEDREDIKTCVFILVQVLDGIETFKRKSFRETYIIPDFIRFS